MVSSLVPANAAVVTVDDDGFADYSSIQEAVNNTSSGDTILVYPGTYVENVVIGESGVLIQNLTIISQSGDPNDTIIQANDPGDPVFSMTSIPDVTINGFTVTGGDGIFFGDSGGELRNNMISGGVRAFSSGYLTIINNIITSEGIIIDGSPESILEDNEIFSCSGTGIIFQNQGDGFLVNNTIYDNNGGILIGDFAQGYIYNNTIYGNERYGIELDFHGYGKVANNTIYENSDAGIKISSDSYGDIYNNYFNNTINFQADEFDPSIYSTWNITKTAGTNIVGGPFLGGNYWAHPNGTGFSQISEDLDEDGICDSSYIIDENNVDHLPLAQWNFNHPPVLGPIGSQTVSEGELLTITLSATDADGDTLSYSTNATSGTLTGNVFEWIPGYDDSGVYSVEFSVSDGNATDSEVVTITVNDATLVVPIASIDSITPNPAIEGETVTFNGSGTRSDGTIVGYNWTSSIDGLLNTSANFTTSSLSPGTHTIYFRVQDDEGFWSAADSATVTINKIIKKSSGGGGSGGGGGGGATGEAFENILVKDAATSFVVAGEMSRYEFSEEKCHISYVLFKGVSNAGQISTLIEILKDTSTLVDSKAPGIVYQNMNIWVGNAAFGDDKIEDAVIGFRVSKEWMSENSIDVSRIALYRYSDGEWDQLSTTMVEENDEFIYFEAETPGFSPFAIAGAEEEAEAISTQDSLKPLVENASSVEDEDTQPEDRDIPWVSAGSLVLILVGVHLLMRKRC